MKIKTENEFQDKLDAETSWRKKELSCIKSNVHQAKNAMKQTELRAGIALLYAHWEGLVKNVATYYLCYVSCQKHKYVDLHGNFLALTLKHELQEFDETKKMSRHNYVVQKLFDLRDSVSKIPYENVIKTNSNLNSEGFVEIMETIGLDYSDYEPDFKMLDDVLLKMRNEIAHGEKVEYLDLDETRFDEIYKVILKMMRMFVGQIENAVVLCSYLEK